MVKFLQARCISKMRSSQMRLYMTTELLINDKICLIMQGIVSRQNCRIGSKLNLRGRKVRVKKYRRIDR